MRPYALFINGVFESVLEEIWSNLAKAPGGILFLQPHSDTPIVKLRDDPPSTEDPVTLYLSKSNSLDKVSYLADIIGWEDKTKLTETRKDDVLKILDSLQPEEGGLFNLSNTDQPSVNLLSIRRFAKLGHPFSVEDLIKISDGKPLSPNRSRAGGWSYVRR